MRYYLFVLAVLLTAAGQPLYAQPYKVFTIAGTGSKGMSGDGSPAVCATIESPKGIAVDAFGNVYIGTQNNIRRVDGRTGIISTLAATQNTNPYGVCIGPDGNVYYADYLANLIHKVNVTTGVMTTLAGGGTGPLGDGGPAISATINRPTGIAVDSKGNIYFCDGLDARIRKVDAVTGIITTIAGTGINTVSSGDGGPATSATVPFPESICVDQAGDVYEGELQIPATSRVRKIDMTTGIITTLAGSNLAAATGDGGPAVNANLRDPAGLCMDTKGNLYIDEGDSGTLRKIDAVSGIITTIAGQDFNIGFNGDGTALSTTFDFPVGICADAAGNIYVADDGNHRARKLYQGAPPGYPNSAISISGNGSICAGSTVSFTATATAAGPNPVYQWAINGDTVGTNSPVYEPPTFNNGDVVTCKLILYQTTCPAILNPASNKISILIGPPVAPSVSISADLPQLCTGSKVTFTPSPVNAGPTPSYQWLLNGAPAATGPTWTSTIFQDGDVVSCLMEADPTQPCLLYSDAIANDITLSVSAFPAPAVTVTTGGKGVCQGDPAIFQAAAANAGPSPAYQWQINGMTAGSNDPVFTDNHPSSGNKITCRMIANNANCPVPTGVLSDTLYETVYPLPVIGFDPSSYSTGSGQQVRLNATLSGTGIQSFTWSPADFLTDASTLTPLTVPLTATTAFQLTVTSTQGCSSTGNVIVQLLGKFMMPGAFTPNGDGHNDVFRIPPSTFFTLKEMDIYNRWGVRVFNSRNIGQGWDGTYGGHPAPAGVYVYAISGAEGNNPVFVKGAVVLVR
ncbi:MAG TPA: gliding motility-associated C-terminal domain-containing protein [Puia sp.]